jgi:hypothetical protein
MNEARGSMTVGAAVGSFALSGPTVLCRYFSSQKSLGQIDRSSVN